MIYYSRDPIPCDGCGKPVNRRRRFANGETAEMLCDECYQKAAIPTLPDIDTPPEEGGAHE